MAAYNHHVNAYGKSAPGVDAFLQAALAKTLDDSLTAEELTALALETGKYGVDVMAALDEANTSAYGHPEVTRVNLACGITPPFWSPATTSTTWSSFWSRLWGPAWTFTPMARCYPPTTIPPFRSIPTLWATTATPGGSRRRTSRPSAAPSC